MSVNNRGCVSTEAPVTELPTWVARADCGAGGAGAPEERGEREGLQHGGRGGSQRPGLIPRVPP